MTANDHSPSAEPPGRPETGAAALAEASRTLFTGLPTDADQELAAVGLLRAAGPRVTEVLSTHSFLGGRDESFSAAELFLADDGDEIAPEWEQLRGPYVARALVVGTTLALAEPGLGDRGTDVVIRVAFGLDPEDTRLRDVLVGPWGRHVDLSLFDPPLWPRDIPFEEVFRRTCLLGVKHALGGFQRAAAAVAREWAAAVIESIEPARGCAGDWVDIRGTGFGQSQPPGVTLNFSAYSGGLVVAPVDPADWQDRWIRVRVPVGVGKGPVGFLRESMPGLPVDTVASAAEQLGGEALACLGLAAIGFAERLRTLGARLDAPHIGSTTANVFAGGPPKIVAFLGNGSLAAELRPRGPLVLAWLTDNSDTVEISAAGPPELPEPPGNLPTSGEHRFDSVETTSSWQGSYTLTATNQCGSVSRSMQVTMRDRKALVLAGGGSKGAFEVGAVRCLYGVFGYRPDLLCGASVGALNAAKLSEGPAALPELTAMWLAMKDSSDLYAPTAVVTRLVNNLAQLGVKYVAGIDLADLLGVRLANQSWLSPDAEIAVGVAKNAIGLVSGAGTLFTVTDVIFAAARAGLLINKIRTDLEKLFASRSIFHFDPVRAKIDALIDPVKIAVSRLELRIATVDLNSGQTRYVTQQARFADDGSPVDLRDALQASASIPIAFPPVPLDGGTFVDGGVRDNAPLEIADTAGASDVIAVLPSPDGMAPHDYSSAPFPALAARTFEAIFDETWQDDLRPFRGYNVPVRIIAPQIETHSLFKVDPGLVRIDMAFGWMRAFDEMHSAPNEADRARLRTLSLQIAAKRLEVWAQYEHRSEGELQDEERGGFLSVGLQRVPSADSLVDVRRLKLEIRAHCLERQTLVKDAQANPPGIEAAWQKWEEHKWIPLIATPWEASSSAHVGPPVPKVPVPPALPPP